MATSPNPKIDEAISDLLKQLKPRRVKGEDIGPVPPDMAVKIINTAIAWVKVQHHIADDAPWNPDNMDK